MENIIEKSIKIKNKKKIIKKQKKFTFIPTNVKI